jgi:hypothetical protein
MTVLLTLVALFYAVLAFIGWGLCAMSGQNNGDE